MDLTFENRLRGGLYGLLVGDAVGVPYEFNKPEKLPPFNEIDMEPPAWFSRTWVGVPTGSWSDDGSQALILIEALLERKGDQFPTDAFISKLLQWKNHGYMAVDGRKFDIGMQTLDALNEHEFQVFHEGEPSIRSNGNGSLMRALPVALITNDNMLAARWSIDQSNVTHRHMISKMCCILYVTLAQLLLVGYDKNQAIEITAHRLKILCDTLTGDSKQHVLTIFMGENTELNGTGYVVDSFWSALQAFRVGSTYEEVIKHAIAFGNDTDTTACIAGGLAGIYYGASGIKPEWIAGMRDWHIATAMADRLVEYRNGTN